MKDGLKSTIHDKKKKDKNKKHYNYIVTFFNDNCNDFKSVKDKYYCASMVIDCSLA